MPTYAQILEWIKAAGFEHWSWVFGVAVPLVALITWFFKGKKATNTHPQQTNRAQDFANVSQQIGGSGNTVTQHNHGDPALVNQLLDRISAKDRELGQKDQLIASQTAEIEALRRQAIETVVDQAQTPGNDVQANSALVALKFGSIDLAQSLLREMERSHSAAHDNRLAARLAREQAALWLGRNVEAAYEAFERAHQFEPNHLPTLGHLVELAKKCKSLPQAAHWADLALKRTEKLAASDPKNSDWQRDLSVSFNKVAGVLEAQGERAQALTEYKKSLAIREKLAASDPKNAQWQTDLVISYVRVSLVSDQVQEAEAMLIRALEIVNPLHAHNKLSAVQKAWKDDLEAKLAKIRAKM